MNNHLAPGELVLVLEIHGEMKHSLLWVLLAAIPVRAWISNTGREGMLDDATSTSLAPDHRCLWMRPGAEPVVRLAKLRVAEDTLQPLKSWLGCQGTIFLAWAEPAGHAGACGLAHMEPMEMPTWQEASNSSSALPS